MKITLANQVVNTAHLELSNAQRWLYGLGNLGCSIPYQAVGAVLLFFYTDVRHLNPVWAAAVMSLYSIYNAVNNPLVGYISDRTRSRWGRRVPYILFSTLPYALFFALLFFAPMDGRTNPIGLLVYFGLVLFLFETLATLVQTAYYALLPEMFDEYKDRTSVAVRMNIFMTVGLLAGAAMPTLLAKWWGWSVMGAFLGLLSAAALFFSLRGMFERSSSMEAKGVNIWTSLRATLLNKSFVLVVVAQSMRHFATATLSTGMAFYTKYSLGADPGLTSIILATAFVVAALALWPWQKLLANRLEARTTLMIAYAVLGVSVIPLMFVQNLLAAILTSALVGVGLAGLLLMGDVTLSDVIDEDELKTGQRREGMYFGMGGFIITLSYALSAQVFAWVSQHFGYNPLLIVQPESVADGFRFFMSIPPAVGALFAIAVLYFYPLHGKRLREIKSALAQKSNPKYFKQ
ncbi:MAG: MFS transporter [Chloroflexi bacterium]|nr:MFS transporter [Chloroflexota bacterium]